MTEKQAKTIIKNLKIGKKYFQNLGSSREGISFLQYSFKDDKFVVKKGFYHFDYDAEEFQTNKNISETNLLEELIAQNLNSVKDWTIRK